MKKAISFSFFIIAMTECFAQVTTLRADTVYVDSLVPYCFCTETTTTYRFTDFASNDFLLVRKPAGGATKLELIFIESGKRCFVPFNDSFSCRLQVVSLLKKYEVIENNLFSKKGEERLLLHHSNNPPSSVHNLMNDAVVGRKKMQAVFGSK
jgi:hypothetical protein